jgi:DNA-binding NarL/FixJ family response regulator
MTAQPDCVRVGLVDPFPSSREGMALFLQQTCEDMRVVFKACDGFDTVIRLTPGQVDVLVISDYLGNIGPDGFTLATIIRNRLPYPPVMVAAGSTDHRAAPETAPARAAAAGAWGYVDLYQVPLEALATAIRQAAARPAAP